MLLDKTFPRAIVSVFPFLPLADDYKLRIELFMTRRRTRVSFDGILSHREKNETFLQQSRTQTLTRKKRILGL